MPLHSPVTVPFPMLRFLSENRIHAGPGSLDVEAHTPMPSPNRPNPTDHAEVPVLGVVLSWLAMMAILVVTGAGVWLFVQGFGSNTTTPVLMLAAAFIVWLAVVSYRLVRTGALVDEGPGTGGPGRSG